MPTVITYSAPGSGQTINLCKRHDEDGVTRRAPNGAEYCQVQHGRHAGTCDVCPVYVPCAEPPWARWDVPSVCQGQSIEVAYSHHVAKGRPATEGAPWRRVTDTSLPVTDPGRVRYFRLA